MIFVVHNVFVFVVLTIIEPIFLTTLCYIINFCILKMLTCLKTESYVNIFSIISFDFLLVIRHEKYISLYLLNIEILKIYLPTL